MTGANVASSRQFAGDLVGAPRRPTAGFAARELPAWPLVAGFVGFPIWWLLGVVDVVWIVFGAVMVLYLVRAKGVLAPPGIGLWLLFLVLVACSAISLSSLGELLGFSYRFLQYAATGVIAVYVFNARGRLTPRLVVGTLIALWLTTVVGGFLGVLWPTGVHHSPLSYVLPQMLLDNELVNQMVVRRFAQFNPEGFFELPPRPSAPYLYTNNWGNAFSLLFPFVLAGIALLRGTRRRGWLLLALPISFVPAFLTLNRGMFIGLALAGVYAAVRLALAGRVRALVGISVVGVVAAGLFAALPVADRLGERLEGSDTTEDRASLYVQSFEAVTESPVFGYGAPQDADNPNAPPVGTQGQFWLVLVSHGPLALLCFVGWMFLAWLRSLRRRAPVPLAANVVLLVAMVELLYYGMVPYGLPIVAVAVALALRPEATVPTSAPAR